MALPKKLKKDINLLTPKPVINPLRGDGPEYTKLNPGNLPRGIDFTDLDNGFVEWVKNDLSIVIENEFVPVSFLTAQRWSEFTRTWRNSDKYKNIKIPFISVVRKPDVQPGTNPQDFNIPLKDYRIPVSIIPKWDGNKKGADIYLIPQPVGVDLTYTIRFFTYRMTELNKLNQKVLTTFASAQSYVNIKGHYFPIMLESIGDESTINELDGKRYYVQTYELKMMAYTLEEDKFELRPGLERAILSYEISNKKPRVVSNLIKNINKNETNLSLITQFTVGAPTTTTIQSDIIAYYTKIETTNIISLTIKVNDIIVESPFYVKVDDTIKIIITKNDSLSLSEVILKGVIPS